MLKSRDVVCWEGRHTPSTPALLPSMAGRDAPFSPLAAPSVLQTCVAGPPLAHHPPSRRPGPRAELSRRCTATVPRARLCPGWSCPGNKLELCLLLQGANSFASKCGKINATSLAVGGGAEMEMGISCSSGEVWDEVECAWDGVEPRDCAAMRNRVAAPSPQVAEPHSRQLCFFHDERTKHPDPNSQASANS